MTALIFILVGILIPVYVVVLLPLFETEADRPVNRVDELLERQAQLQMTIDEIEFDHAMKQIPDEDFERLWQEISAEADSVARQLNPSSESK